jgi:hypothetical protein
MYKGGPHNAAVLTALLAAWQLVGDATAPDGLTYNSQQQLIKPYCVVYPLGTSTFDGSLDNSDAQADAWPTSQVTSVGSTREQADFMRDTARAALLGTYLTVAGRRVGPVRLVDEQPARPDYDVTPYLFYAVDRFRIYTTPST